jgi:alkylation response protein AidB-like acyl-CoA dehydrogenase
VLSKYSELTSIFSRQQIITQELARITQRGYEVSPLQRRWHLPRLSLFKGLLAGTVIGLPPVLNFGRPEIAAKVVPEVLSGKKLICLAVTEAFAGSDVAGLKTTATKTEDGKYWIVNGTKKWITNGT